MLVEVSNYRADFSNVLGTYIRVLDAVSQRSKFWTQFGLQLLSLFEELLRFASFNKQVMKVTTIISDSVKTLSGASAHEDTVVR